MGTAIIVAVIIVICIFAVRSYVKKLSHGCCGAGGDDEKKIQTDAVDLSDYNYRYTVSISGMTCKNCSTRIENRFNRLEGVYAVVSHKDGMANIYAMNELTEISIRQVVVGLGYTVNSVGKI